jgi:hypothetical protein
MLMVSTSRLMKTILDTASRVKRLADVNNAIIATAHPVFASALRKILGELQALGWEPRVAELRRTPRQQAEKVRQGYSTTQKSWHVDSTIGLLPSGRGQMQVVHGNAADIVDNRLGWSGLAANPGFQFWKDLGRIAKEHGCEWGGDWKTFKDVAHIQMLFIEMPPQFSGIG